MILIGLALLLLVSLIFLVLTKADRTVLYSREMQLQHEGITRNYLQYDPPDKPAGIIIGLDGLGGSGRRMAYFSALHNVLPNYIVLYPDAVRSTKAGISHGWNAGFCCGSGWVNQVDDIGFIKAMIAQVRSEQKITLTKVHVVGLSNGGMFAHRLAVQQADLIASLSVVAGSLGTISESLKPVKPVPALLIHGMKDTTVPFEGGVGSTDPNFTWLSFTQTSERWADVNSEGLRPNFSEKTEVSETVYSGHTILKSLVYKDVGHTWPGARTWKIWQQKPSASQEIARFIKSLQ